MRNPKAWNGWLVGAFMAVAFLFAPSWTCDDAFISFRYVDNLVAGHGLVFNAGERVEGYTNFLWVILLAGLQSLGMDPIPASRLFGLIFLGLTVGVVWRTASRGGTWPIAAASRYRRCGAG